MKAKTLIPILLVTHAAAGAAGFFIARSLLVEDKDWVEKNAKDQKRQQDLDDAVADQKAAGEKAAGEKAAAQTGTQPTTPDEAKPAAAPATPPADFEPTVRSWAIQSRGMSRVAFTSDAPLEAITGTTTRVEGSFRIHHGKLSASKAEPISVAVGTLKTGIDLRDEHLQGDGWFDTANHPNATFQIRRVQTDEKGLWYGHTAKVTLHGTLTIKGISKDIVVPAEIGYFKWTEKLGQFGIKEDILRIKSQFEVRLSDFGMSAGVIGQKVAEVVEVSLNLTAIAQPDAEPPANANVPEKTE